MSINYRASYASLLCASAFMIFSSSAMAQTGAPQASGLTRTMVGKADV